MPDKTWIAGDVVTAADTNTYLTHTGGAWTAYTPTFTNLTVGNGTLDCQWFRSGRFVSFKVKITFGSTTSVSGAVIVSLPVAYADGTEVEDDAWQALEERYEGVMQRVETLRKGRQKRGEPDIPLQQAIDEVLRKHNSADYVAS